MHRQWSCAPKQDNWQTLQRIENCRPTMFVPWNILMNSLGWLTLLATVWLISKWIAGKKASRELFEMIIARFCFIAALAVSSYWKAFNDDSNSHKHPKLLLFQVFSSFIFALNNLLLDIPSNYTNLFSSRCSKMQLRLFWTFDLKL